MRDYIIKFTVFLAVVAFISGCTSKAVLKSGNQDFQNLRYASAIEKYHEALEKDPDNREAQKMLAQSYQVTHNYERSRKFYDVYINSGESEPVDKFNYAKMLMSGDNYEKAELYIREYLQSNPSDRVAKSLLESCQFIEFFRDDTALYEIQKIPLFSNLSMFSPVRYGDGIAFTAERISEGSATDPWTNNSYYDIYYANKTNNRWEEQKPFDFTVNGKFHEGPISFNQDKTKAVFTRSYSKSNNKKMVKDEDNFNNLFLYEMSYVDGKWTNVTPLPFNNESFSCMHPALSRDGKTLYFSSDMPGGMGKNDLYVSTFNGTEWSNPTNLGETINTPEDEVFPVLRGEEVIFSSNGHPSLGGLDLFKADYQDDGWQKPKNLNFPVNSTYDDFSMILENGDSTGYFSSNREGVDRIYEFVKKPSGRVYIDGIARLAETGEPLREVKVILRNNTTGEILREIITDEEGKFDFVLLPERNYKIEGIKDGYFKESYERSTINQYYDEEVELLFSMVEIVSVSDDPEKRYVIENIYYDLNKYDIRPDAAIELDKLVRILKDNPTVEIQLFSHTDSRGDDQYNLDLSDKRARAVVTYLVSRGIDKDRLTYQGMGETQLINDCVNGADCTDAKHEENRRSEFTVTKYKRLETGFNLFSECSLIDFRFKPCVEIEIL